MVRSSRSVQLSGDTVLALRERWGLTQAAFGRLLGFSREWVARAEQPGVGPITKKAIERIAELTGTPTDLVLDVLKRHTFLNSAEGQADRNPDAANFAAMHGEVLLPSLKSTSGELDRTEATTQTIGVRRIPFFDVKIPASGWAELGEGLTAEEAGGYELVDDSTPRDAFALRIDGDCMEPDFPSGSVIVFVPVRPGERDSQPFQPGKPYYFEHSDGKATFKLVYYEPPKERYRLQCINPKYKPLYVPEQMLARMSRAVKVIRNID